jgi:hypothetical protein
MVVRDVLVEVDQIQKSCVSVVEGFWGAGRTVVENLNCKQCIRLHIS